MEDGMYVIIKTQQILKVKKNTFYFLKTYSAASIQISFTE